MNKDMIINRISQFTGSSRKEVIEVLRKAGFLKGSSKEFDIKDK
jgi:hypothetical protein